MEYALKELQGIFRHLLGDYTEPVRDPVWKNIYLSGALKKIVNTREMQKLGRIKQLGPSYQVYPGATHTRLNHSFGVFYLSKKIIDVLLHCNVISFFTLEGVKAFLSAALLHDIGHFPFAHSLKELPLKSHEILTGEIILNTSINTLLKDSVKTDPYMVAAIIDENLSDKGSREIKYFRHILSGVLDPDKLDYLNRDAFFCGVPYGFQDTDFIEDQIIPHEEMGIGVKESGLPAVENILFSKYLMYRSVYWHKTVRIATAMIKKGILMGIRHSDLDTSLLYGLDDDQFNHMFAGKKEPFYKLISDVSNRRLYKSVYESTFKESNPVHRKLLNLEERSIYELEISRILSKETRINCREEDVIIDVPEPISFETNLPILTSSGFVPFHNSRSVFQQDVVGGFSRALRKIRLFLKDGLMSENFPYDRLFK